MTYHVRDYHLALAKKQAAPLTLTEPDFEIAAEFGGPQEEQRFRDAHRHAQLALAPAPAPVQTKAAMPLPHYLLPEPLADAIIDVIKRAVVPVRDRVATLETELAAVKTDLEMRPPLRATGKAWAPHQRFLIGDLTTHDGSLWLCMAAHTASAPFAHEHWRLVVKRGRDGRDAK